MLDDHESWNDWLESPPPYGVLIKIGGPGSERVPSVGCREAYETIFGEMTGLKWRLTGIAQIAVEGKHFDDLLTEEDRKWLYALRDYADAGGVAP